MQAHTAPALAVLDRLMPWWALQRSTTGNHKTHYGNLLVGPSASTFLWILTCSPSLCLGQQLLLCCVPSSRSFPGLCLPSPPPLLAQPSQAIACRQPSQNLWPNPKGNCDEAKGQLVALVLSDPLAEGGQRTPGENMKRWPEQLGRKDSLALMTPGTRTEGSPHVVKRGKCCFPPECWITNHQPGKDLSLPL